MLDDRPHILRPQPIRLGELIAHLSDLPQVFVTACCDLEQGKAKENIVEHPNLATSIARPPHIPAGMPESAIALLSARDCVEPTSYRTALSIP
jgi:hypothetical protein